MYKLIIKSTETGTTVFASVSNNNEENFMEYARRWINENGYSPDKVLIEITSLRDQNKHQPGKPDN
jgi:hypothetical protein